MTDDTARIGTVYLDEETGEYVMPADFAGDEELRWRCDGAAKVTHDVSNDAPSHDSPEDYEMIGVSPGYIGLEEQKRLYELRFEREVDRLWDALADPVYVRHIHDLGLSRLAEGYRTFRDAMYQWPDHVRQAEQDEELADYFVYGTSEP